MKNFLVIFFLTLVAANKSYGAGYFLGADVVYGNAKHTAKNSSTISGPKNGDVQNSNKLNYGFSTGYRMDILNFLGSAELFYDDLQTSAKNFALTANQSNSSGDSIQVKNRYGVKANVGFTVFPKVTPFLSYGLANVVYSSNVLSSNSSITKAEVRPIYGAGILIDLPLGFSAKASYDYQQFDMRYAQAGSKIKTHLGVAKVGLIYNF